MTKERIKHEMYSVLTESKELTFDDITQLCFCIEDYMRNAVQSDDTTIAQREAMYLVAQNMLNSTRLLLKL